MSKYLYLLSILISIKSFAQSEKYKKHLYSVISKAIVNKTFVYNTSKNKAMTTTSYLTYLGKTRSHCKVLYIKETYPAALVRHGYVMLLVIDSVGAKYEFRDIDKPVKMRNGILYFKHQNKNGSHYYFTQDLNKGIPKFLCIDKEDCYDYGLD